MTKQGTVSRMHKASMAQANALSGKPLAQTKTRRFSFENMTKMDPAPMKQDHFGPLSDNPPDVAAPSCSDV